VAVFDRCGSTEVRDVDTVTSRLAFPMAMVGYCIARYAGFEEIMAAVPKMMRHCAQPWRDVRDAMPPHAGFIDLLTHVN
jgi:hypothetical protein